ncbi:polysaccharide biosynthesis protein [Massilicoli timonensis]|uniref:Polysaccharide biosynthesis protein n=1 Tax=Massilicoli timonensis TaxID=2015901 RepID=A0ABT1SNS2_9FIRM|nr:nucleoside-diphosphate sugar epimerase/dehydratase [Massilicoli timonensis]MCQ5122633.1 polysaccharide biosynthesis protein [Massilicoli timonensis]
MIEVIAWILNNKFYQKYREYFLLLLDLFLVCVSFLIAFWTKEDFLFRFENHLALKNVLLWTVLVIGVYTVNFLIFKVHRSLWKYIGPMEAVRLCLADGFATLILMGIATFITKDGYYTSVIFVAGLLNVLLMLVIRFGYRLLRRYQIDEKKNTINALIIGAGDGGYILLKELTQNESYHAHVVGFLDDFRHDKIVAGKPVLGTTEDLAEVVKKHRIQIVFIAIPSASKKDVRRIYEKCQDLNLETKIMRRGETLLSDTPGKETYPVKDIAIEDLLGRGEIRLNQQEIRSYITGKVVAVTGAGGSIGSELCRQIVKFHPRRLVLIDINENTLYMLEQEFNRNRMHGKLDPEIEIVSYIASIRERKAINEVFEQNKPEVVYHAAAHKHVPLMETRPQEAIKNNVFGTNNVISLCIAHHVSRFIMISTDKAVNPTNVMGATKRMTEMILQANGKNGITKMAAVRFGNVLGSNGSVIPIFQQQIAEGGPVTITDKGIIRYFMTIPEAAQLVLQAGYYADKGEIFVLDMGEPVKILNLAEKMIRLSGLKPYEDIDIVEIGLRPGEKMFEELRLDGEDTVKTKNDLIFINKVMDISMSEINAKLHTLSEMLACGATREAYRETMLEMIKDVSAG